MNRRFSCGTIGILMLSTVLGCTTGSVERSAVSAGPPAIGASDDLRLGPPPVSNPNDVEIGIFDPDDVEHEITAIRRQALMEASQSYGSQMGYARRAYEIESLLQERSAQLSQVFDFNRVVSEAPVRAGYILPPIVSRSFDAFRVDGGGREASVAEEYLTIVEPGRIAPVAPTWRDYLLFSSPEPEEPARSLFPVNRIEHDMFRAWFNEGWNAGVDLADEEIGRRLARLRRDYEGMLQYRRLVSLGMMDRMVLESADFGVTTEADQMRIGSRVVRIVSGAEFENNPRRWSVRVVSERDQGIVEAGQISPLPSGDRY